MTVRKAGATEWLSSAGVTGPQGSSITGPTGPQGITGPSASSPNITTVASSGADFTTVSAALAAGNSILSLSGTVTEIANSTTPTGGAKIFLEHSSIWDRGDFIITLSAASDILSICGNARSATMTYTYTVAKKSIQGPNGATVVIDNIVINNTSSAASTEIAEDDLNQTVQNCAWNLPNFSNCGMRLASTFKVGFIENTTLNGGGNSCNFLIVQTGGSITIRNIRLEGSTFGSGFLIDYSVGANVSGINYSGTSPISLDFGSNGYVTDIFGSGVSLTLSSNIELTTFRLSSSSNGTINFGTGGHRIANGSCRGLNLNSSNVSQISNVDVFTGGITSALGNFNRLNNVRSRNSFTIGGRSSSANDCVVGNTQTVTTGTITIDATGTNCHALGNTATISDGGTTSVVANNSAM
jgi:hypothetical protein